MVITAVLGAVLFVAMLGEVIITGDVTNARDVGGEEETRVTTPSSLRAGGQPTTVGARRFER
jgi:hypothetical protein